MAVASLNKVSARSSSLILESQSPLSKWCANHEKPYNQASLLQMWRELEVEHVTGDSQPRIGGRSMQGSVIVLNSTSNFLSTGGKHGGVINSLIDSNEKENEQIVSPRRLQNKHDDSRSSGSESLDIGKVERERVREVFREWQNNGLRNNTPRNSHPNNCSKPRWLGEKERERVRIVRDWVENTTQQRGRYYGGREGQDAETGAQIVHVREGLHRKTIHRLCGRQTLLDLLIRAENERRRELQDLLKHRHVSDFSYRNRIQSLLKGRFLREETYKQEEKPSSSELGILRQKQTVSDLRDGFLSSKLENFVSGRVRSVQSNFLSHNDISCYRNEPTQASSVQDIIPDEFCSQSESTSDKTDTNISFTEDSECGVSEGSHQQEFEALIRENLVVLERVDREQLSSTAEFKFWRTFASEHGDIDRGQLSNGNHTGWRQTSEDDTETNSHASSQRQYQLHNDSEYDNLEVPHNEWHDLIDTRNDWPNEPFVEEVTTFYTSHFSDNDNGQSLELRQLVSRRRVSNLLRSDFRTSLEQLIQSHVERRDHAPVDWETEGVSSSSGAVSEEEQEEQTGHLRMSHSEALLGTIPTVILPSEQISSSQTVWNHNAFRQKVNSLQHSRNDWEIINELKVDMARLHQRMDSMQRMLEACMDMQLQLQLSVRQEVSAALNWQSRSADCENLVPDESNLEHVKNGVCCICCTAKIDSLLYRCGHMCACSKCAQKLVEGRDICPMCRAPVIEVIRAYSIHIPYSSVGRKERE